MNTVLKSNSVDTLPKKHTTHKKSIGERIMENIPDGRYKGLEKILESHEIPKRNRQ